MKASLHMHERPCPWLVARCPTHGRCRLIMYRCPLFLVACRPCCLCCTRLWSWAGHCLAPGMVCGMQAPFEPRHSPLCARAGHIHGPVGLKDMRKEVAPSPSLVCVAWPTGPTTIVVTPSGTLIIRLQAWGWHLSVLGVFLASLLFLRFISLAHSTRSTPWLVGWQLNQHNQHIRQLRMHVAGPAFHSNSTKVATLSVSLCVHHVAVLAAMCAGGGPACCSGACCAQPSTAVALLVMRSCDRFGRQGLLPRQ